MKPKVARFRFSDARSLIEELEKLEPVLDLRTVYVNDCEGDQLTVCEVFQEQQSDGGVVFELLLFAEGDPDS